MKNEKNISPDDLFRENLNGFEVPYEENSWVKMSALLEESEKKRPVFWWFQKNKKYTLITLITLIMITSTIILALQFMSAGNTNDLMKNTGSVNIGSGKIQSLPSNSESLKSSEKNAKTDEEKDAQNHNLSYTITDGEISAKNAANNQAISDQKDKTDPLVDPKTVAVVADNSNDNAPEKTAQNPGENAVKNEGGEDANKPAAKPNADAVTPTPATDQPATPKLPTPAPKLTTLADYNKSDGPFRGGWIGMHYTSQYPQSILLKDSWRQNAGFNVQFMSHNLTGNRTFAGYLGFDFGMQFTGRGKNSGIVLDNKNLDSGFTRLSNYSIDFFARGHFEYAKYRLKPYFNLMAGPRIFATSQYTEAYHQSTQYDNSNNTNAYTSVSWMYGAGVGLRYRLSPGVSFDMRYEIMQGTETNIVNLDKSKFNGLTYDLSKFKVSPAYTQFKVGFLFDLDEEETLKHPDETTEQTEYFRYDSTSQKYIKVQCNCKQWAVSDTTSPDSVTISKNRSFYINPGDPSYSPGKSSGRGGSIPSGGGSTGGGRGSFPGIRSGGGGIRIKN